MESGGGEKKTTSRSGARRNVKEVVSSKVGKSVSKSVEMGNSHPVSENKFLHTKFFFFGSGPVKGKEV